MGLQARDKEYSFLRQLLIPGVIVIGPINSHHRAFRKLQCAANANLSGLAFSDRYKLRKIAAMIQPNMEFDGSFGGAEISPGKDRQAQVDRRGIQRIQWMVETKMMTVSHPLATLQQLSKERLVQRLGLVFVDAR